MGKTIGAVRVFTTKDFARFARKEKISDDALCGSIRRADRGIIDADLGGNVIKQRVARKGQGRSGGYRTIIAYRAASLDYSWSGLISDRAASDKPLGGHKIWRHQ